MVSKRCWSVHIHRILGRSALIFFNMKQHKIGIIVYGIVGKRKREYIDLNPYFQTHYVKDVNFDGEGNFSDGVYYFKDYREIFDHELDIVFVS